MSSFNIYADGSSTKTGNGGSGLLIHNIDTNYFSGFSVLHYTGLVTNNICELSSVIIAMKTILYYNKDQKFNTEDKYVVFTDSQYVQKGLTIWSKNWVKRNWINSEGQPVANKKLWKLALKLHSKILKKEIDFQLKWVKGHSGNPGNEVADRLACTKNVVETKEQFKEVIRKHFTNEGSVLRAGLNCNKNNDLEPLAILKLIN